MKSCLFYFFLFCCSNTGGIDINRIAQRNYFENIKREDYDVLEFQKALANAAFAEKGF